MACATRYGRCASSLRDFRCGFLGQTCLRFLRSKTSDGQTSPPDEDGNGVPDEWEDFWDDLNDAVDDSGLEDLDLYIPDVLIGYWWNPFGSNGETGFDCDDYATAMIHFLEGRFPDADISYIHVFWGPHGHSMVLIEQDDTYFVVDPQTGQVVGPFDSLDDVEDGVREILDPNQGGGGYNDYDADGTVTMNPSDGLSGSYDPPPFYEDTEILRRFREGLADVNDNDSGDYTPND